MLSLSSIGTGSGEVARSASATSTTSTSVCPVCHNAVCTCDSSSGDTTAGIAASTSASATSETKAAAPETAAASSSSSSSSSSGTYVNADGDTIKISDGSVVACPHGGEHKGKSASELKADKSTSEATQSASAATGDENSTNTLTPLSQLLAKVYSQG